jgi:hypothetical protein
MVGRQPGSYRSYPSVCHRFNWRQIAIALIDRVVSVIAIHQQSPNPIAVACTESVGHECQQKTSSHRGKQKNGTIDCSSMPASELQACLSPSCNSERIFANSNAPNQECAFFVGDRTVFLSWRGQLHHGTFQRLPFLRNNAINSVIINDPGRLGAMRSSKRRKEKQDNKFHATPTAL